MEKAEALSLLSRVDELTVLMEEYNDCTDKMVTSDLEIIREVLITRNGIMDRMRKAKAMVVEVLDSLPQDDKELARHILNNGAIMPDMLTDELRQLQAKMHHLHSLKAEIDQKDRKVSGFVVQSFEDVKAELESLKTEKKRIDYYNNVKLGGKGRTFSTNS